MRSIEDIAIDNYIEALKAEAEENLYCGLVDEAKEKFKEADSIYTLRNAIESANKHGFLNDWSEETFIKEFGEK